MTHDEKKAMIIREVVAQYFGKPLDRMLLRTRTRDIVEMRQFAMYFMRSMTELSLTKIGNLMGGFDHCTVLHSQRNVHNLVQYAGYGPLHDEIRTEIIYRIRSIENRRVNRIKVLPKYFIALMN